MGGTRVIVILGIAASQSTNYGSKPSPDTPAAMKILKKTYPAYSWKAGHLLNDGLGGRGENKNLTPLTGKANRNLSTIENWVKNLLTVAYSKAERGYQKNPQLLLYAIRYEVKIAGRMKIVGDELPAPASVTIKAEEGHYRRGSFIATRTIASSTVVNEK
jgi:hypothetical protein